MPSVQILLKPVSAACNLRCSYCFYADEAQHRAAPVRGTMTRDTAEAVIGAAFRYAASGTDAPSDTDTVTFAFQGGEPTLAGAEFYRSFVQLAAQENRRGLNVRYALQTNGIGMDASFAAFLAEHGFLVGVSLDGTRTLHDRHRRTPAGEGTYAQVLRCASLLRRQGAAYNILCVVTDAMARPGIGKAVYESLRGHEFLQFIPCLAPLGGGAPSYAPSEEGYAGFLCEVFDGYYRDFRAGTLVSVRLFDNFLNLLLRLPPESCAMCGVCQISFAVEADGSIYPCDFYALDDWLLGNITSPGADLAAMAAGEGMRRFLEASHAVPQRCRACRYYPLCRNGCARERTLPDGRNRYCHAYRMFFDRKIGQLEDMAARIAAMRQIR